MNAFEEMIGKIITIAQDPACSHGTKMNVISSLVQTNTANAVNLFKNIQETSVGYLDKKHRYSAFPERHGISVNHVDIAMEYII